MDPVLGDVGGEREDVRPFAGAVAEFSSSTIHVARAYGYDRAGDVTRRERDWPRSRWKGQSADRVDRVDQHGIQQRTRQFR
jgi:hypothetical protein